MVKERKKGKAVKSVVFKKRDGTGVSFKARYGRLSSSSPLRNQGPLALQILLCLI